MSPADQAPSGYVLIDKPSEWSSHDVVAKVRRLLGVKRVGHAGTLDPIATGLLIVLVGRDFTRQQDAFLKLDKDYEVEFELGYTTDTYDAAGQKTTQAEWSQVSRVTREQIEQAVTSWLGTHSQQVPAFSAVKHHGRKLYQLARYEPASLPALPSRTVTFHQLELTSLQLAERYLVRLRVGCSSGTYIRSLVQDLGRQLAVGATMTKLRRTKIGELVVEDAIAPNMVSPQSLLTNI